MTPQASEVAAGRGSRVVGGGGANAVGDVERLVPVVDRARQQRVDNHGAGEIAPPPDVDEEKEEDEDDERPASSERRAAEEGRRRGCGGGGGGRPVRRRIGATLTDEGRAGLGGG